MHKHLWIRPSRPRRSSKTLKVWCRRCTNDPFNSYVGYRFYYTLRSKFTALQTHCAPNSLRSFAWFDLAVLCTVRFGKQQQSRFGSRVANQVLRVRWKQALIPNQFFIENSLHVFAKWHKTLMLPQASITFRQSTSLRSTRLAWNQLWIGVDCCNCVFNPTKPINQLIGELQVRNRQIICGFFSIDQTMFSTIIRQHCAYELRRNILPLNVQGRSNALRTHCWVFTLIVSYRFRLAVR